MNEDTNGTLSSVNDASVVNRAEVVDGTHCYRCDTLTGSPVAFQVTPAVTMVVAAILSFGVVVASCLFIALCFVRPDAANIVIPVVVTAVIAFLARRERRRD